MPSLGCCCVLGTAVCPCACLSGVLSFCRGAVRYPVKEGYPCHVCCLSPDHPFSLGHRVVWMWSLDLPQLLWAKASEFMWWVLQPPQLRSSLQKLRATLGSDGSPECTLLCPHSAGARGRARVAAHLGCRTSAPAGQSPGPCGPSQATGSVAMIECWHVSRPCGSHDCCSPFVCP